MIMMMVQPAAASPLVPPGDSQLRHDIQWLSDRGAVPVPLTTWPLAWADVRRAVQGAQNQGLDPVTQRVLQRVQSRLNQQRKMGFSGLQTRVALAADPIRIRRFQDTPREEAEAALAAEWTGQRFAGRLEATAVADPVDDRNYRLDGSWAGAILGNWVITAGLQDRWWGPGWDGSLVLSHNARPVPAVAIQRHQTTAFDLPVLRWLGPWRLDAFIGQLEDDRTVPEAKLLGARLTFMPLRGLEIGIFRTAQWGGDGRPQDFDSFIDLLAGRDNRGDRGVTEENEPGNQLGGLDFRWRSPIIGGLPYAIYAQGVGEDEAGNKPSREIGLAGVEHWGGIAALGGTYRAHFEYANTTVSFFRSEDIPNAAYEHGIYRNGYRHRARPIGHGADNDSEIFSAGLIWITDRGRRWAFNAQLGTLNEDGRDVAPPGGHTLSRGVATDLQSALLQHGRDLGPGRLRLGLGVQRLEAAGDSDLDVLGYVQWSLGNW